MTDNIPPRGRGFPRSNSSYVRNGGAATVQSSSTGGRNVVGAQHATSSNIAGILSHLSPSAGPAGRSSPVNRRTRTWTPCGSNENSSEALVYSNSSCVVEDNATLINEAPFATLPRTVANRRLLSELKELEESPVDLCEVSPREDNILMWTAVITGPKETVYEGGTFFVELRFSDKYPFEPPKLVFLTRIYHCNINSQGKVCMDAISSGWSSTKDISSVLQALISLLYACNPRDALVPCIAEQYLKNPEEYDKMARIWTQRYAQ
ncbi:ubiquitin-conjugating enzyme domain-containing protein [Ditylenchus destructor]|uniref:E2 ubiquitin-conjugating enzyme n=1 Tax=Ditylenchus destructor TaxID=166010 RepID=A0AAD4RB22_9BILA|nr:ubiquitin-conjugating enzyme domain-containing protein [Ditylenchus destructor]